MSGEFVPKDDVTPELVAVVEQEVAAWINGAWTEEDRSLEHLTRVLLAAVRKQLQVKVR